MYAAIAYYALHKLKKFPNEIFSLPENEQAFVIAAILEKSRKDEREARKMRPRGRG